MKKTPDIFELTICTLAKNNIDFAVDGETVLSFDDTDELQKWDTLTALAMCIQQTSGIDNGLKAAAGGTNAKIINSILKGETKLIY